MTTKSSSPQKLHLALFTLLICPNMCLILSSLSTLKRMLELVQSQLNGKFIQLLIFTRPIFKDFYYAFIQFQRLDHARKALENHKYPTLCGVKCRVLAFNKQILLSGSSVHPSQILEKRLKSQLIFVKGLPKSWTHEDLSKAFEKFGKVLAAKVSVSPDYTSRGYGFVQLDSDQATITAIKQMNESVIPSETEGEPDSKLVVCEFVPRNDRTGSSKPLCSTNLYVKNFPND